METITEPLEAHTHNEVRYYLMVTPCHQCGKGPYVLQDAPPGAKGAKAVITAVCKNCSAAHEFSYTCSQDRVLVGSQAECINPSSSPSRIIDLGQWLSLFYVLIETAASEDSPPAARQAGYQAAMCLSEALKFYGDNELPPESAFFRQASIDAFHEHPENFARQKLRDMLSRLPTLPDMARRLDRDQTVRRRWWKFWK